MCLILFLYLCAISSLGVPLKEDLLAFEKNADSLNKTFVDQRIVGGLTASEGQFPYLAAIYVQTSDGTYFCGGALMTTQWVLTAGHCVDGAILFTVLLGSNSLDVGDSNLIRLATDTYILHPEYEPSTLANDIGLIQFRMAITFTDYVKPIDHLPTRPLPDFSAVMIMGWGQVNDEDAGLQDNIRYISITTMSNEECKQYYGSQILDTMVCAEGNYNEGLCFGDTGGPVIQYVSRGKVMIHGIASFISQNGCENTDPSGITRVFDYNDWINNITGFS